MPLATESLFRLLVSKRDQYDVVLPAMPEMLPEPLCGLYSRRIIEEIGQMIKQKDFAVNHLLIRCHSRIVPISKEMECWQADLFLNVNSKEDLHRLPPGFGTK